VKESLVIMEYLENLFSSPSIRPTDPYARAVEGMLCALASDFVTAGYVFLMNQSLGRRQELLDKMTAQYAKLDAFLCQHSPDGTFLFEKFGYAEAVFTPFFQRFWFLAYYEGFTLPEEPGFARVRRWVEACLKHPAAQQASFDEIVKLYYDYAKGVGNGAIPPGRTVSSFSFEPDCRGRPMPPKDKYNHSATDFELGLV
jgi:glutathione S-transferase